MRKCYTTVDTIVNLLPVSALADLCGICRSYCYKLLEENTKVEIFKKYCEILEDKSVY